MRENPYQRAPGYPERYRDVRFQQGSGPRTHRREVAAIVALLRSASAPAGPWLDVPSGAGRLSDLLPHPVVQVDRDPRMLGVAPPLPGQRRVCASALALPFADATFAGVLCLRLFQHLATAEERVRVLTELARTTHGLVLLSYFEAHSAQHWRRQARRWFGKPRSGRSAVSWRLLRAEMAQAGLRPLARLPLLRFLSEQTLVLAARCNR